ncbi:hypothetical protein MKX03_027643, partial [Papaver bracteatum]
GAFDTAQTPTYGFGFDPLTKTYKLVYVLEIPKAYFSTSSKVQHICQVLTVGGRGNQWRNIDEVPPVQLFESAGVYANGSIYWRNAGADSITPPDEELIVAFDIGTERFRVIEIPDFIVGPPEILLEDSLKRDEKFTITPVARKRLYFLLPSKKRRISVFIQFKGQMRWVIKTLIRDDTRSPRGSLSLNIYNRTNKSFRMIDITGITPLLSHPYRYDVDCVHESLVPVEDAEKKLDQHTPMV